jgi:hypothetical protein
MARAIRKVKDMHQVNIYYIIRGESAIIFFLMRFDPNILILIKISLINKLI